MNRNEVINEFIQSLESFGRAVSARKAQDSKGLPTPSQIGILFRLSHAGPLNFKQLANMCGMTSSAVTQLVEPLVKDGLLTRTPDKKDRRIICIDLTDKGRAKLAKAKLMRVKMITNFLQPLTDTELAQLKNIQAKIVSNMTSLWKSQPHK